MATLLATAGGEHARLRLPTVETIFLQRIYVLFFISLATRRIEYVACSSNLDGRWTSQQARHAARRRAPLPVPYPRSRHEVQPRLRRGLLDGGDQGDSHAGPGPNANAFAERWVRTVRADCLDRILILGPRHLEHVLRVYRCHYNEHRPHRALRLLPPDGRPGGRDPTPLTAPADLRRRDLLGGLIHEYDAA